MRVCLFKCATGADALVYCRAQIFEIPVLAATFDIEGELYLQ